MGRRQTVQSIAAKETSPVTTENKRFAVVIGVSSYEDDIVKLPYAKNDAYRVQSVLQETSGFSADRVYFLANGFDSEAGVTATPPTRSNILQKVKYVCGAAGPEDLIVLYFAGHGAEISKNPYLISSDTRMDVLSDTALNVDQLNDMLSGSGCRCVLRFFDACRSSFAEGRGGLGRMTDGLQRAVMECATGWASFSSCSSGEVAHESGELNQGIFTYYLCEGLSGKARNSGGNITIESLVDYVKTSVGNWCDRQTLRQRPHFQSDLSGSLVLATPAVAPADEPPPNGGLFADFVVGIDQHLSGASDYTRRLTFTDQEEWGEVSVAFHQQLATLLKELSHPAITATLGEMESLRGIGKPPWREFNSDLSACALLEDFTGDAVACRLDFQSSEVVVPSTTLYVAVARFSFFYWLWYCHVCDPQALRGKFNPDPPLTKGYFTIKPSGAKDREKAGQALREMMARSSRDLLMWAAQLGEYVESKLQRLSDAGPIIE